MMKTKLKKLANLLTIFATAFLVVGLGYVFFKGQSLGDLISQVSFSYLAIAVFNYLLFGAATLWHMDTEA